MSIFDKLLRRGTERKTISGAFGLWLPGPIQVDAAKLVDNYRTNSLVRAAVQIKAQSMTDPRLIVQIRNADLEWEEAVGHPFRRVWIRPNPEMSGKAFIRFLQKSQEVAGRSYIEIVRSQAGSPVELWPLMPTNVKPLTRELADGREEIVAYKWEDGNYSKTIPPQDMIVRDDLELGGTLSPLETALSEIDMDSGQTDYIRGFFNNAGVPSGILTVDLGEYAELTQEMSDEIRSQWRSKYGRTWGNLHDLAVMDTRTTYQKIGASLTELDSDSLRAFTESRICMAFGVPPLIVYAYIGLMKSTYSNLAEAWRQFWLTTMSAELSNWRDFLMVSLLPQFVGEDAILEERVRLSWDMENVGALAEDVEGLHRRERLTFQSGATRLNEFRTRIGLQELPEESVLKDLNYFEMQQMIAGMFLVPEPETGGESVVQDIDADPADLETVNSTEEEGKGLVVGRRKLLPPLIPDGRKVKQMILDRKQSQDREAEKAFLEEYKDNIEDLVTQARDGELEEEEFQDRLKTLAETSLVAAFLLGMLFGDDGELTAEEWEALESHLEIAKERSVEFSKSIYSGEYGGVYAEEEDGPEEEAGLAALLLRAGLWVIAAKGVIELGRIFRRDDPLLEWRYGPTDHCTDCLRSHGAIMRASAWRVDWPREKLPQGRGLECNGYNCLCGLYEVAE